MTEIKKLEFIETIVKNLANFINSDEIILLDYLFCSCFSFYDNNAGLINKDKARNKKIAFVITKNRNGYMPSNWKAVYSSSEIEIFENKTRYNGVEPLRWGLSKEEQLAAVKISREVLKKSLKNNRVPALKNLSLGKEIPRRFYLKGSACVSLWKGGELRGCRISQKETFLGSLSTATQKACRDSRSKPLEYKEIKETIIEISLLSDILVPLENRSADKSQIHWDKGYIMKFQNKQGWHLPEVFNISKFKNNRDFLNSLKDSKVRIPHILTKNKEINIETFEVFDFVEKNNRCETTSLIGPVSNFKLLNAKHIMKKMNNAANWLVKIQEKDGNFIPIISTDKIRKRQMDWPRSILAAISLAEFGKNTNRKKFKKSAKISFEYFVKYILKEKIDNRPINFAYLGQLALSLGKYEIALECTEWLIHQNFSNLNTIAISQSATLFLKASSLDKKYYLPGSNLAKTVMNIFNLRRKRGEVIELAYFAEAINNFIILFEITKNNKYLNSAINIARFFINNQLENGSFKITGINNYANSRSTGKMLEAITILLSKDYLNNRDRYIFEKAMRKGFLWMLSMQYTEDNIYHIYPEIRKTLIGAIRHTHLDSDAWIDSVAHLLLAFSRFDLTASQNYPVKDSNDLVISFPLKNHEAYLPMINEKKNGGMLYFQNKSTANVQHDGEEIILNHSELLKFLFQEKIIRSAALENILVYKKFPNAPGFYEAYLKTNEASPCFSRGFSKNWDRCLSQVTGEILERYFHHAPHKSNLLKASVNQLKKEALSFCDLECISVFSNHQKEIYPNRKWDDDSEIYWEKCANWKTKEIKYFPAQLVYRGYKLDNGKPKIRESNTSGLGGFFTQQEEWARGSGLEILA